MHGMFYKKYESIVFTMYTQFYKSISGKNIILKGKNIDIYLTQILYLKQKSIVNALIQ